MEETRRSAIIKEELRSTFSHPTLKIFYSIPESVEEFTKPCGRFKSTLSFAEKFELRVANLLGNWDIFKNMTVIPQYTIKPNWQVLLNYLFQQGIIAEPKFSAEEQRNDFARFNRVSLSSKINSTTTGAHTMHGYGTSTHAEEAYSKAVGELLERYFLASYKKKKLLRGSYNSLTRQGKKVLDLDTLPGFLPWQKETFKQYQYDKDSLFNWIQVQELVSKKRSYVPAQLIFWRYGFDATPTEPRLKELNTNGQAGGFTRTESILSAIYETVERDAFLIFWLNTLSAPVLDISQIEDPEIQKFVTLIERYGIRMYVLDTTTDIAIPSCTSVLLDERGSQPRVTVGSSSGFNMQRNIFSSTIEALGGAAFFKGRFELSREYQPFIEADIGQRERVHVWEGRDMLEKFNFFISGEKVPLHESTFGKLSRTFESKEEEYEHVLDIFRQKGKGYEVYAHTVKHPVLTKLGYYVTKVVIPALLPMYLKEHFAPLDSPRLRDVPAALGYKNTTLNPWPHPFP